MNIDDVSAQLNQLSYSCRANAEKKLHQLRALQKQKKPLDRKLQSLQQLIDDDVARLASRDRAIPDIHFPDELPIAAKREEIAALISDNQVVVIAGETGSGKTTQIPKICLSLGLGRFGMIGHTQPRRIAARTVAARIADELTVPLGGVVGYQVRFTDQTDEQTAVKLMTDGILLMEIQRDPLLLKYDTLIIDEAHERSLNIDFLLGYLKQLLPRRPELKVIVTSATIDVQRFSAHFDGAPVLEVSGRMFPVEVVYRPWQEDDDDLVQAMVASIEEIRAWSSGQGDILVFLSGERDIREASLALKKANLSHLDILPLYGRLSMAEQTRVFQEHRGTRVVLATNVAETSITVPGIRYVIDTGLARISRYSVRTKVQRLPIEPISQASANQRKGRCGRVADGVCIRLYSEEDFNSRPEFTDAEVLRTNLAAVILQMLQLRIGDVRQFPFVDRPDNKLINDGFKLLEELDAVNKQGRVTEYGKRLARLPVDPRLARMLLASGDHGCLQEMLIIVSALSLADVRERPADKQQAADEQHRRFYHEHSDFLAYVSLWHYLEGQRQALSSSQFKKCCQREFLNYMRVREWRDLHRQLTLSIRDLALPNSIEPASYEALHRAILTGLVANIGRQDIRDKEDVGQSKSDAKRKQKNRDYIGTRNRKFRIFPGSSISKKSPTWLMAAEYMETSQLFALCAAKIEPSWVVDTAPHLLKYQYSEPHYDVRSGQVKAYAKVSLFGLVLIEKQRVNYQRIDAKQARDIFIRQALVEGGYRGKAAFYEHNQAVIADIQALEAKSRRRDIMVDEDVIFQFYHELIPESTVNVAGFEHWYKKASLAQPELLFLYPELLMRHAADELTQAQFPDQITVDGVVLPLSYHFEPGHVDDGVSIAVPIELLHRIAETALTWLVPGLLRDKCIAMVKGLPKSLRKKLVPVPQYVDRALVRIKPGEKTLTAALADEFRHLGNVTIGATDWQSIEIDDFYLMNIQVINTRGEVVDRGRDIRALRERYREHVQTRLQHASNEIERDNIGAWDFGDLPVEVKLAQPGALSKVEITGYPALVDNGKSVAISVCDNPNDARMSYQRGVLRLALLALHDTAKYLARDLLKGKDIGLTQVSIGSRAQVIDELLLAGIQQSCFGHGKTVRTQAEFEPCVEKGRADFADAARAIEALLAQWLGDIVRIKKMMKTHKNALPLAFCFSDIKQQLDNLFHPGFLVDVPLVRLQRYSRYLSAIIIRLERAALDPKRDQLLIRELQRHWQRHQDRLDKEGVAAYRAIQEWQQYRWMIEEYRISLFAQTLKTQMPVSSKRLDKQWQISMVSNS